MKKTKIIQIVGFLCLVLLLTITGTKGAGYLIQHSKETSANSKLTNEQQEFNIYLDNLFRQEVTSNTINLHYTLKSPENYGIKNYTVTYGNMNQQAHQASMAALENVKAALADFNAEKLTLGQQLTYDTLSKEIETELSIQDLYLYQELLRPSTGIQAELPILLAEYTFYDEGDIQDYLALLQQTPDYFQQILLFEMEKANNGLFMPEFAAEDIITQCKNFIADKENNYLLTTFNDKIDGMAEAEEQTEHPMAEGLFLQQKQLYKEQNQQIVTEAIIPAYEMLIQGMEKLKSSGQNQQGLYYLPNGVAYYEYLVKSYVGSDMSVEEMQEAAETQRAQDLTEAAKLIAEYPDLLPQTTAYTYDKQDPMAILQELQEKMKGDFPTAPDTSFTVKYVHPSLEEYMSPAFYLSVPIDDISQNAIYINGSSNYQKLKLYTTLAHEGFPGHLYQNLMERSQDFPAIRSMLGTSGYSEGWATYVEMISYSYADIEPQLATLLQKDQSALLSLYASADMGIHYQGWSLEKMMEFFGEYQITDKEALTGIYRLIIEEPAHYLKYYIGYLEFLNLKARAKDIYGEQYSDYQFHEALMKMGPAQFSVLEKYLSEYYPNNNE